MFLTHRGLICLWIKLMENLLQRPSRRKQASFSSVCEARWTLHRWYIWTEHLIYISQSSCLQQSHAEETRCGPGLSSSAPGRQTAEEKEAETPLVCSPLQSDVTRCSWCLRVQQQTDFDHPSDILRCLRKSNQTVHILPRALYINIDVRQHI